MQAWQMQEAKAHLPEVVKCAQNEGPQDITLHGRSVAVVSSRQAFEQLAGSQQSLVDFMQALPLKGLGEVQLKRDTSQTRTVKL
jgi:prevent-host-death family protein